MAKTDLPQSSVYILKANKKIYMLLCEDSISILYIGKGIILNYYNRIGKFINALNTTENYHYGGHRFNIEKIIDEYLLLRAEIEIFLTDIPEKLESEKLGNYLKIFGELPPFNRREESI